VGILFKIRQRIYEPDSPKSTGSKKRYFKVIILPQSTLWSIVRARVKDKL